MTLPYFRQERVWTCGPAVMRMVLASFGVRRTEEQLVRTLRASRIRGTSTKDLVRAAEHFGFNFFVGRNGHFHDLHEFLEKEYRIIVGYYHEEEEVDHYAVIHRLSEKKIYLYDPWAGSERSYSLRTFKRLWWRPSRYDKEIGWFIALNFE